MVAPQVWQQLGNDIDGEAAGDWSGFSVSLSSDGSRVAIGAIYNDGTDTDAGHVRIFEYSSTGWQQLGSDLDGEAAGDYSGYSVSLSSDGSRVAIGATDNDGTDTNAGHVRIFEYSSTGWQQLGSDIEGEAAGDFTGISVSLSSDGSRVAIGASSNDGTGNDAGHVRIFEYSSTGWQQLGSDIDGEAAGDYSGYSVSLSSDGSRVAIGAIYNDVIGTDAGHVRIYEADATPATAAGDPHVVNTKGEAFDVFRPGLTKMLRVPRDASWLAANFTAKAMITDMDGNLTNGCSRALYITSLYFGGAWFGGGYVNVSMVASEMRVFVMSRRIWPSSHRFSVGDVQLYMPALGRLELGFGTAWFEVGQGKDYTGNFMNMRAHKLKTLGCSLGGILGESSHESVSTRDTSCALEAPKRPSMMPSSFLVASSQTAAKEPRFLAEAVDY